ncbi:site-specific recombinase [Roseateles paludis]|uniref:Site-specific recombinase n=1 Tax=Roseateles paludis TaxID=3145238 RepID=A0ABV0FY61_9BURK
MTARSWDLTALLNAADPDSALPERNLWLVRLLEWLRHPAPGDAADDGVASTGTPLPVLRLKHLLNVLERHPEHAQRFAGVIAGVWTQLDAVSLFADVGFAPRTALWSEFLSRLGRRLLPASADTQELSLLFELLFPDAADEAWLAALDDDLVRRLGLLFTAAPVESWRREIVDGITVLVSQVSAAGFAPAMRLRMDPGVQQKRPFQSLVSAWEGVERALRDPGNPRRPLTPALQYLRGLLDRCRSAARSVPEHLEAHGVSVDLIFGVEQMLARTDRIEALLACLLSPDPGPELRRLTLTLVREVHERRSIRTLFAQHYSLLARKLTERSAETGEHYITRTPAEYRDMLRRAAGGGSVIAGTTLGKFALAALGLTAFWGGFWAGMLYALSFVLVHLLHWTVATKQPAMTAPALATRLRGLPRDEGLDGFVDEVAHLFRSQVAGIVGNVAAVVPLVLLAQGLGQWLWGSTPISAAQAHYVLHSLDLLGPTLLFAAFTGVLLFVSSLIAGWVENWFVFQRLDSAIAWSPRIVAVLGQARAQRWAAWWRANISGLTANFSLGLLLGLVPAVLAFFGLPIEVRHVTLSAGQLTAAAGALGPTLLATGDFWRCVVAIVGVGMLNVGVSFYCAFRVALRAQGVRVSDRRRVRDAVLARLRQSPRSFFLPPPD